MKILFNKRFDKTFKKMPLKLRIKFYQQIELFQENPTNQQLNNHALSGQYFGYRSIDVSGDVRAIFKETDINTVRFMDIGTNSQLYG